MRRFFIFAFFLTTLSLAADTLPALNQWTTVDYKTKQFNNQEFEGVTICVPRQKSPFLLSPVLSLAPTGKMLVFEMASSADGDGNLFYKYGEDGQFGDGNPFRVKGGDEFHTYRFVLKTGPEPINRFRLAAIYRDGVTIRVKNMRLEDVDVSWPLSDLNLWTTVDYRTQQVSGGIFDGETICIPKQKSPFLLSPELALDPEGKILAFEMASNADGTGNLFYRYGANGKFGDGNPFKVKGDDEFHTYRFVLKPGPEPINRFRLAAIYQDGVQIRVKNMRILTLGDKLPLADSQLVFKNVPAVTWLPEGELRDLGSIKRTMPITFAPGKTRSYSSDRAMLNFPAATGKLRLMLQYRSTARATIKLTTQFFDCFAKERLQTTQTLTFPPNPNGRITAELVAPSDCTEFRLTLTPEVLSAPLTISSGRIDPQPGPEDELNGLQSSFIWLPKPQWQSDICYFRKTFEVAPLPISAILQLTADNAIGEIYLNGVRIPNGPNSVNRMATDCFEVAPLLKKGRNVIAVKALDYGGARGLLCELALYTPGQPFRLLLSDASFKVSPRPVDGWMTPEFDDAAWLAAEDQKLTAFHPKGMTYTNLREKQFVSGCNVAATVKDGRIEIAFSVVPKTATLNLEAVLRGKEIHRFPLFRADGLKPDQPNVIRFGYPVPKILGGGDYTLELRMPEAAAPLESLQTRIALPLNTGAPELPRCRIVYGRNRVPMVEVNGKPASLLHAWEPEMTMNDRIIRNAVAAGVHQYWVGIHALWSATGAFDYSSIDRACRQILQQDPDAQIILEMLVGTSEWENFSMKPWNKAHPDQLVRDDKGNTRNVFYIESNYKMEAASWASEAWLKEACSIMRQAVEYVKKQPYTANVIGFFPLAGLGHEWKYYSGHSRIYLDYSLPAQQKFREYVLKKYGSLEAVGHRYREELKNRDDIRLPSPQERDLVENGSDVIDPATRQRLIDYREFFSDMVASAIDRLAAEVKAASDGRSLCGTYYGYVLGSTGYMWNESGHHALTRLLHSPNLDFLVTLVTYHNRKPGQESGNSHPVASFRLNGKASILQTDFRTHHAGDDHYLSARNVRESGEILKRELAWNLVNGAAFEYGYFGTGWIGADPRLMQIIGKGEELNGKVAAMPEFSPDSSKRAAFLVDEPSINATLQNTHLHKHFVKNQKETLPHSGFGFDIFLTDSLPQIQDQYKFFIFANNYQITPERRKQIDALKKNGNTLFFFHAPGISDGETLAPGRVGEITGIRMAYRPDQTLIFATPTGIRHPMMPETREAFNNNWEKISPLFIPEDGEVLARINGSNTPALVVKKYPGWTAIYSLVPLTAEIWQRIGQASGLHLYNRETSDSTMGAGNLLALHTSRGGQRILTLPYPCREAEELFTGKRYPVENGRFTVDMEPGSTALFLGR